MKIIDCNSLGELTMEHLQDVQKMIDYCERPSQRQSIKMLELLVEYLKGDNNEGNEI